ncbi:hypothetical protein LARI1_G004352 [Lachnellula arida]|uniref:N-acetyltransferase domain-containing protein n=1 Tax=Lachnellula arida TaxID=1316785 RepID=A0A8T9B9S4_9HELO|nr:hypothetical protein LARI1_G004352 [Lachnellula arida]
MQQFAFPALMASKDKTGLVGCVGVKEEFRGQGVASLLVSKAIQNLQARGVEGVFVDWVAKEGLYERMGFETVFEYEQYVWGGALEGAWTDMSPSILQLVAAESTFEADQ